MNHPALAFVPVVVGIFVVLLMMREAATIWEALLLRFAGYW